MFLLRRLSLLCAVLAFPTAGLAAAPAVSAPTSAAGSNGAATFGVTVTANGAPTTVIFEYGKTNAYGRATAPIAVAADAVATLVSASVSGLVGGHPQHFRAVAKNADGEALAADATIAIAAYDPVLTIQRATDLAAGRAKLSATITTNGSPGTATFEYSTSEVFASGVQRSAESWMLDGTEEARTLSTSLQNLERDKTYYFRLFLDRPDPATDQRSPAKHFFTNQRPVAMADVFVTRGAQAMTLAVLANDSDGDGDTLQVTAATTPGRGIVTISTSARNLVYTPRTAFVGADSFIYTLSDRFTANPAVTGSVKIRALSVLYAGNQGGLLVDENGDAVGYFKISATETGAFTGSVLVQGVKQSLAGTLGADGTFRGSIEIDGRIVPVALKGTLSGTATTLEATFDDGRWTAALRTTEASPTVRAAAAGRYTVEFPGGTSTSDPGNAGGDPAGSGWAALKLSEDGVARIKGRLPDGRSFSTRGILGVATTGTVVTFFDDPRHTRISGTLTLGNAVAGSVRVERDPGGSGLFSAGYGLQRTASGARYLRPDDGRRAIEGAADASGRRLTFAVTGGDPGETFTRELRVDQDDEVTVLDRDSEGLKVKIDRDSGRFTAWFKGSTDNQRIKGTGVFIQGTSGTALGRGTGVFTGANGTGRITITAGGSTTPVRPDPGTIQVTP